ncbi:MAG: hypothetical protein U5N10_18970 [Gemmobacter sp.]|nr:hypothetical protein [Gemmobacter sp.]
MAYDDAYTGKVLPRTRSLDAFIKHFPESRAEAHTLLKTIGMTMDQARFLPAMHKQEWIAVLDSKGRVVGFLPGDGFAVP